MHYAGSSGEFPKSEWTHANIDSGVINQDQNVHVCYVDSRGINQDQTGHMPQVDIIPPWPG